VPESRVREGLPTWLTKSDRAFSLALFCVALALRLVVALAWAGDPVWDGEFYHLGAVRLAAGLGYSGERMVGGVAESEPWSHYPVGLSALLAPAYMAFGPSPRVGAVAGALLGALVAPLTHRVARYALSPRRARVAGLVVALSPELVLYAALVMTEVPAALSLVLASWLALRGRGGLASLALGGAALGLGALVRPPTVLFAPALGLVRFRWAEGASRVRALALGGLVATLAAVAVVAPWTARNCVTLDGCAFVSTNGGWNLAIGASPEATGRYVPLSADDWCPGVHAPVAQDRCLRDRALAWVGADPLRWIGLASHKMGHTWSYASFPVSYLAEARPAEWSADRARAGLVVLTALHALVLTAAALALVPQPPRSRAANAQLGIVTAGLVLTAALPSHPLWLLAAWLVVAPFVGSGERDGLSRAPLDLAAAAVGIVCATSVVFFGENRYHVVASPMLALLAAAALRPRPRALPVAQRAAGAAPTRAS
jgi:hypothetical protein